MKEMWRRRDEKEDAVKWRREGEEESGDDEVGEERSGAAEMDSEVSSHFSHFTH